MAETIGKTWAEILEGGFKALWVTMDDEQKARIVQYCKTYIGKTTADGIRMTWERFGSAVGTTGDALKSHYHRSEAGSTGSRTSEDAAARFARSNLKQVSDEVKAEIIAAAIAKTPDLATRIAQHDNAAYKALLHGVVSSEEPPPGPEHPETKTSTPAKDIVREWETWLAQGNAWLMRGAKLVEKTEIEEWVLNGPAAFGPVLYQRITDRKLDAELRELLEGAELR